MLRGNNYTASGVDKMYDLNALFFELFLEIRGDQQRLQGQMGALPGYHVGAQDELSANVRAGARVLAQAGQELGHALNTTSAAA